MFNFLNDIRKEYIHNFFRNKILINLNHIEFNEIIDKIAFLIEYISVRFSIRPIYYDIFWDQLIQNNHRDLIAIFNLMLPYIDDKEGKFYLHKELYDLKDISEKKIDENSKDLSKNNYLISNIKYNLYYNDVNDTEQQYNIQIFRQNFSLLLKTINEISNKLFTNWLNVVPLTITNYNNSYLYENSLKLQDTNISTRKTKQILEIRLDIGTVDVEINIPNPIYIVNNDQYSPATYFRDKLNVVDQTFEPNKNILDYKGIGLNDVFNTLYYDLFLDVVKLKWLIYQDTFDNPNIDEIYIKKFNNQIAIPGLYLNKKWQELTVEEQILFSSKWDIFLTNVLSKQTTMRNSYFHLLKSIIIFFERNYDKINYVVKNFNYVKITTDTNLNIVDDDDNDNELTEDQISELELISRINKIPHEDMYSYLLITIQQFIKTWYGKNIIRFYDPLNSKHYNYSTNGEHMEGLDNVKFVYDSYCKSTRVRKNYFLNNFNLNIDLPEDLSVNYKFFYNYAKAFFLIYKDKNVSVRPNFKNLNLTDQENLILFLNSSYSQGLELRVKKNFNVMSFRKYYQRTYSNSPNKYNDIPIFIESRQSIRNLAEIIGNYMFLFIRNCLPEIVFESHIMKGLLNEFVINPYLTDNNYLGSSYDDKKNNQFKNLKKYVFNAEKSDDYLYNSFYFLTDKPYSDLYEIHRNSKKSYFDLITSEYRWYSFYSMDWVAQISFFHRYINNRVIYVTGATGQGKSTQVPKLFLYGLKMIDRKSDGKVICSQPRVAPTRDNSEQISFELGVPITETSANYKQKIKTFNPFIQYKTQNEYHLVENHNGLMLKLVTDRLLYMELMKSPIFKEIEKSDTDTDMSDAVEFNVYKKENMYDIIMVDESHEHNLNMDLVLTIARDTIKYNNSLKLVIVSATMTEDEPIYRRYYREIDDNLSFPFSDNNSFFNFDRYSVDRRIHISPPGETTQHKVTDNYLNFEPADYSEAEKLAIEQLIKLASDISSKGDILFFSLSAEDIKRVCKTINESLPSNSDIICLPFYRELPSKWDIFNELSKKVKQITVDRTDLFDEIYPNISKITKKVPAGTYKRAIVVATNIAEASITIDSLKYVIDTGYFISVSDNPYTVETNIDRRKISEASRIQRRGRVGRVGSGTVYYMYMKDSRKNFKSEFKICIENISKDLWDLMPNKYDDNTLFPITDWYRIIQKKIPKNFEDAPYNVLFSNAKHIINSKILKNLLQEQYTSYNNFNLCILNFMQSGKSLPDETFYRRETEFPQKKTNSLFSRRQTRLISGYDIKSCVFDQLGDFYIVHPEEKYIKRNILTGAILEIQKHTDNRIIDTNDNIIISHRIYLYIKSCFTNNLLIDHYNESIPLDVFEKNDLYKFNNYNLFYEKSNIGRIINKFIENGKLKFDDSPSLNRSIISTLIYANLCNVDDIVLIMLMLLQYSNYQLSGLNENYKAYGELYDKDDLYIYYKIAKNIYEKIKLIEKNSLDMQKIIFSKEKKEYLLQKQKIFDNIKNKLNYWNLDISIDNYNKFNILDNQNKLDSNKNISDYVNESAKRLSKNMIKPFIDILNEQSIKIDSNGANKLLKYYVENKSSLDKLKNTNESDTDYNKLLWFKYNMSIKTHTDQYQCIKNSFIYGFGILQSVMYNPLNNCFVDLNLPSKQFKPSSSTLTKPSDMSVYLNRNTLKNEISIIIGTEIDTLTECNLYGFNPYIIQNFVQYNNIEISNISSKLLDKFLEIISNKNKYFNHLKTNVISHPKLKDKLFACNNNFTEYLIKLWSSDIKSNIYNIFPNTYNNKYMNLTGGYSTQNKIIKININKINNVLKKLNINYTDFVKLLSLLKENNHHVYYKNNYLYLN
jgi:hypothetical protein